MKANFSKTCALVSRKYSPDQAMASTPTKYVSKTSISIVNSSEQFWSFWSHSSVFAIEKWPKNLNFYSSFFSKRIVDDYFQWNQCTHFEKICTWLPWSFLIYQRNFHFWRSHSSFISLEDQPKNLNFHGSFISKILLGGYFQWNMCTQFQKICIWPSHEYSKFIIKTTIFLVFIIFLSLKELLVATFSEICALTSRKYVSQAALSATNLSQKLQYFWLHFSFFALEK